jgi:hypothetical protein
MGDGRAEKNTAFAGGRRRAVIEGEGDEPVALSAAFVGPG